MLLVFPEFSFRLKVKCVGQIRFSLISRRDCRGSTLTLPGKHLHNLFPVTIPMGQLQRSTVDNELFRIRAGSRDKDGSLSPSEARTRPAKHYQASSSISLATSQSSLIPHANLTGRLSTGINGVPTTHHHWLRTREGTSAMLDLQKPGQACTQDGSPAASLSLSCADCNYFSSPALIHSISIVESRSSTSDHHGPYRRCFAVRSGRLGAS